MIVLPLKYLWILIGHSISRTNLYIEVPFAELFQGIIAQITKIRSLPIMNVKLRVLKYLATFTLMIFDKLRESLCAKRQNN